MKTKMLRLVAMLAGCGWLLRAENLPPIACNLKALTSEQRKELRRVGEHVISAINHPEELRDGYGFAIDPAKASLLDLARWLDLWRRCCPFYEFQVNVHAADGSLWMSVQGRPGVKEYIPVDSPLLGEKLHSVRPHASSADLRPQRLK